MNPGGPALATAGVLLVAGLVGGALVESADDRSQRSMQRKEANAIAGAVEARLEDLDRTVAAIYEVSRAPGGDMDALLHDDGVSALAHVLASPGSNTEPRPGAATLVGGTLPEGVAVADLAAAAGSALELARDSGMPRAGATARGMVAIAVPHYSGTGAPLTTQQRRERLRSWTVAVAVPSQLLAAAPPSDDVGVTLLVGGRRAAGSATDAAVLAERDVVVGNQHWIARVHGRPSTGPHPGAIAIVALGVLGALGALALGVRSGRRIRQMAEGTATLARETRTVAELGPLLQQSLDLGEVLPAVAVRLSDEFDLDRFGVELNGERGHLVDVFSLGSRATGDDVEVLTVSTRPVPAGALVALPLMRAGRTIGRLRFSCRQALSPTQIDALRAAADLIAVATYNVELYEREQATVRRLQELDTLKDAFLGTISHELRTPITAIGGFARLLRDRWHQLSEADRLEFLERVQRNSVSLGLLVDDLLDFARLDRQSLGVNAVTVRLDQVVDAIVGQLSPLVAEHHLVTDLAPDTTALADPGALERVIANLLTNAAKFSPAGSTVEVSVSADECWATIAVSDEGAGIPAEERQRIFNRFYRGDGDAARSTRGAGIGLAVVRELVLQMGGEIEVHDRAPHGTRMEVRLPRQPVAGRTQIAVPDQSGPRTLESSRRPQ